jgi:hypothetical protein
MVFSLWSCEATLIVSVLQQWRYGVRLWLFLRYRQKCTELRMYQGLWKWDMKFAVVVAFSFQQVVQLLFRREDCARQQPIYRSVVGCKLKTNGWGLQRAWF